MNNYIQLFDAQKQAVLTQCKNMMGLPEQAVEKDYWVTVMLQLIFDSELSEHIRHHREKFTSILGVDYLGDIRDRICLVPPEKHIDDWRKDYQYMCDYMIYGEKPTFAKLMESMRELERRFRERR